MMSSKPIQTCLSNREFEREFVFTASRSSGPGGQHVNKVSTRIELRFDVLRSQILSSEEKALVLKNLSKHITKDGILQIVSQSSRSQYDNKTNATVRFYRLIEKALTPAKERTPTKPTQGSRIRRLEAKRHHSEKKMLRKINYKNQPDITG